MPSEHVPSEKIMIRLKSKKRLSLTTTIASSTLVATSMLIAACSGNAVVDDATSSTAGSGGSNATTTSSATSAGQGAGCPADNFLDVSKFDGAGSSYPAPTLTVTCEGDEVVVKSNGIPHYTYVPMTPNELVEADQHWEIPLDP